jgi:hypothetical protein
MNMKNIHVLLAVGALAVFGGQALARRVTHPVTPENIDKQPFTVKVKDVGQFKEFEIEIKQKAGKATHLLAAGRGSLQIAQIGKKKIASPPVTLVQSTEKVTFSFQISAGQLDRAYFTITAASDDPFPSNGDYWVFSLEDFVSDKDGGSKKAKGKR